MEHHKGVAVASVLSPGRQKCEMSPALSEYVLQYADYMSQEHEVFRISLHHGDVFSGIRARR